MIDLVVGGARSGKSRYAMELAQSVSSASDIERRLYFVATAEALDQGMTERILRHQKERGPEWNLIEEPKQLSSISSQFDQNDCVVVDCLTLWLTNWLSGEEVSCWQHEQKTFLENIAGSMAHWILVSNETGMGVIPMGELNREFVDRSGWLHQEIANIADQVTLVMFGLPQKLKGTSKNAFFPR